MKLCSITLENFRQFYGKQHIDFSNDTKNITVVLGENGNGKTGIFRAIVFCLFNKKELPKDRTDRGADPNKVHLVNLNVLKENLGMPVEGRVDRSLHSACPSQIRTSPIKAYGSSYSL